jgi:hypothetical protein
MTHEAGIISRFRAWSLYPTARQNATAFALATKISTVKRAAAISFGRVPQESEPEEGDQPAAGLAKPGLRVKSGPPCSSFQPALSGPSGLVG